VLWRCLLLAAQANKYVMSTAANADRRDWTGKQWCRQAKWRCQVWVYTGLRTKLNFGQEILYFSIKREISQRTQGWSTPCES